MLSMLSTTSSVVCSASARSTGRIAFSKSLERGGRVILPDELTADGIEHRAAIAVRLDGDERRAADLLRAHHPARELGGQRGLALAALAAHHGVAFVTQQPLEREQFAAAPDEAGLRRWRQLRRGARERGP